MASMQQSADWLTSWEACELSDEVLADRVAGLVQDRDGARGFFVVAMTSEIPLLDRQPEALLGALRQAGELERHHQPHHREGGGGASAGGMAEHDIALQGGKVFIGDAHAGKFAKAGVDAIDQIGRAHV